MPECAFCSHSAKLSAEHVWSQWMRELFTGKRFVFAKLNESGEAVKRWTKSKIDITAKVVCKTCNEGWMSNLESRHAKPALADLIVGKEAILSSSQARSVARFAFKTAIIVDCMAGGESFFPRSVRHHFAKSLSIPRNVHMWLAGFLPMATGRLTALYHTACFGSNQTLKLYVCTYAVGHFAFQVVTAEHSSRIPIFHPKPGFDHLSIPFWPRTLSGVVWPPENVLRTKSDFDAYSARWETISFVNRHDA